MGFNFHKNTKIIKFMSFCFLLRGPFLLPCWFLEISPVSASWILHFCKPTIHICEPTPAGIKISRSNFKCKLVTVCLGHATMLEDSFFKKNTPPKNLTYPVYSLLISGAFHHTSFQPQTNYCVSHRITFCLWKYSQRTGWEIWLGYVSKSRLS